MNSVLDLDFFRAFAIEVIVREVETLTELVTESVFHERLASPSDRVVAVESASNEP